MDLSGLRILVADDEAIIALDIAMEIEALGGIVVGPAARIADLAAHLAGPLDGAILDVNFLDGDIDEVAGVLADRGVPMVICTGAVRPLPLEARLPDVPVLSKPTHPGALLTRLMAARGG